MESLRVTTGFKELMLDSRIMHALDDMGFENPTEIQAQAIPLIRDGKDIIGRSQTGTGKTMAFAIPAIEKIRPDTGCRLLLCVPQESLPCSAVRR